MPNSQIIIYQAEDGQPCFVIGLEGVIVTYSQSPFGKIG